MSYRINSVLTMLKTILPSLPRAVKYNDNLYKI